MREGNWLSLSVLVADLRDRAARLRLPDDPRIAAALVALDRVGQERILEVPAIVNVAALALAGAARPVNHQIRPAAARLVHETDLHSTPGEAPRLLRGAWLVEVRRPETGEVLWGDTVGLGGYELDGDRYLVGVRYPDGAVVARWRPRWTGEDLDDGIARDASPLIDDVDSHLEWAREAARFAVVLGLLLDAEGVPFRVDTDRPPRGRSPAGSAPDPRAWTTRHVYLDEVTPGRGDGLAASDREIDELAAEQVIVRGHLKRQRHGPGRAEVRWIYVASYEARRWVAPRPSVVVVSRRRGDA